MTTAIVASAMLLAGMAASAQAPGTDPATPGTTATPANSGTPGTNGMPGSSAPSSNSATSGNGATMGSCQQMMDNAKPRVAQMSDATKMAAAQKHMTTAQTNLDAGKTSGCESEMKQVMQLLN
jgi:hypothetical protein